MLNTARNLVVLGRFNPAVFFGNGEVGFAYDYSKTDRLKQLSDGTTAVGTDADPVGWAQSIDPTQRIATQATADSRPAWKNPNFLRFDGTADNLLSTVSPGVAGTLAFKGTVTSASKVVIGSRLGSGNSIAQIYVNASGQIAGGIGTAGASVNYHGSADVRGLLGVNVFTWDAVTVTLYRNNVVVFTGARGAGSPPAQAYRIGANNDSGVAASIADVDLFHALAINRVLTPAEVTKLTTGWGTT
ncbi:hypothetical protein [Mesorhizobium wenxiniae]|uniref:LamG-like jellyroll fold domain-containing protein n=1 Tax=Mesorhizobium wenxiniae TaxID=2014805 RepID=A0A271KFI7_9HYPH|nr:hypothetical protein [Mesorhizobium wenxiniae]PAP94523.1 hypothetical protein CIT31_16115 [Mesorhizobium wenxiniae]